MAGAAGRNQVGLGGLSGAAWGKDGGLSRTVIFFSPLLRFTVSTVRIGGMEARG